ncbi:hypothetical protein BJY52DRAFT_891414 [Lactarius psammicola]|nr:hypothetical protein BJY52DRAFT_891414 [Lactarius psammicola]
MATSHRPPPFPQAQPPTSAPATIPVPGVASSYLTVGPVQNSGCPPQIPSPWITPPPLPPTCESLPSQPPYAHPPASQPIPVSICPFPAILMPQVQVTHAPTTYLDPPQPRRSVTMPIPGLRNDTQLSPGPYPSHTLQTSILSHSQSHPGMSGSTQTLIPADCQRNLEDDSDHEEDEDGYDISAMHDGGTRPKGPLDSDYSVTGIHKIKKLLNRRKKPPIRTQTLPMVTPVSGHTFLCRWCQAPTTDAIAARYGGFCSDGHMLIAIHNRIATRCPICQERACPELLAFCSAACAKGGTKV